MMPYQIFLVEDHPAMREAYATVLALEPDLDLCGSVASAEDALSRLTDGESCDLVVTDLRLPGMSGIELVGRLHDARPELPTLVITGHEGAAFERQAHEAGAAGFLPKHEAAHSLIPTIWSVLRTGRVESEIGG